MGFNKGLHFIINIHLSNRKRFPCLHSVIKTREGVEEFETVMQTRDEVEFCITVENSPNPRVFISGYANTGKNVFYCFYKVTVRKKKTQNSLLWH